MFALFTGGGPERIEARLDNQDCENFKRFDGLDKLRGLLIANMALGHAIAISLGTTSSEFWFNSQSLYSEWLAFLVRYINHSATPFFFLVMGMSMALLTAARLRQGRTQVQIHIFFVVRGLLLICLQFSVVNLGWKVAEEGLGLEALSWSGLMQANTPVRFYGVLYALGVSMILASVLNRLFAKALAIVALFVLLAPDLYLSLVVYPSVTNILPAWLAALAVPGRWPGDYVLYTPIPWLGMTLIGLLLGRLFLAHRDRFEAMLVPMGIAALAIFLCGITLRALIAEPASAIEALHLRRYPPHLLLLTYATGVNFLVLAFLQRYDLGVLDRVLVTFGRTALMLYVTHLFIFAFVIRLSDASPTLAHGASLAVLSLAVLFPLCWVYLHVVKPRWPRHLRFS